MKSGQISFDLFFHHLPTGGRWTGGPNRLCEALNDSEGFARGITENLDQDTEYRVTISFEARMPDGVLHLDRCQSAEILEKIKQTLSGKIR